MDDLQVFAHQVFEAQPFTRYIGAELASCGPGHAEITLRIVDHLKQQHGFVHGGDALTSEYKINYLRPAKGTHLIARAHAKGKGKRQAVCLCDVVAVGDDGTETLCAIAQGTVVAATS
ncbi:PaaI family thioesterase [Dyella terrae]|uniref:PaaI family thioesterase n=1 Tax=Dyella terrae TaxID=522259 RepID=UPI001EFE7702|nr:PaaI family thioesterase [Dyella terrae]ULU24268.1 PaaI family thioesterase [Dyella terrae]